MVWYGMVCYGEVGYGIPYQGRKRVSRQHTDCTVPYNSLYPPGIGTPEGITG